MNRFWILLIYNLLLPVVLLLGFPKFLIKGIRRGGVARNFRQRLGLYTAAQKEYFKKASKLWIHAVSVGEVRVALKVAAELRQQSPGHTIIISTTTPTGFALAEKEAPEGVTPIYNPVDLPWVVGRAMRQIAPECLILVEAEVWPNLVNRARRNGTPVVLINARLSERSERRFRKFSALTQPVFGMLDRVAVQFEADVPRMGALGIDADRIEVTGSVKFDLSGEVAPQAKIDNLRGVLEKLGVGPERRIVLAGSTHAGEEAFIGSVCRRLRETMPDLFYLVVPRHAERAAQVAADLKKTGLNCVLKSDLDESEAAGEDEAKPAAGGRDSGIVEHASAIDTLIANTTGELLAWYHLATVVVIGKSFLGHGGQNPIEAIAAGKPVITGPYMQNFSAIMADLEVRGGVLRLEEAESALLEAELRRLLDSRDEARELAERGRSAVDRHHGATQRTAALILKVMEKATASLAGR